MQTSVNSPFPGRRRRAAFTLLEMLVVMGIMLAIATIVIGSFIASVRGASWRSAAAHFEQAMTLARQRACMDGQTTLLLIAPTNEFGERAAYFICRKAGEISLSKPDAYVIEDQYADLTAFTNTFRQGSLKGALGTIYNIRTGKPFNIFYVNDATSMIISNVPPYDTDPWLAKDWKVDDAYGWALHARNYLPKGFYFVKPSVDDIWGVSFSPDGRSSSIVGNTVTPTGETAFKIREWMGKNPKMEAVVTVKHPSSAITVVTPQK